jgi:hypothetical protein
MVTSCEQMENIRYQKQLDYWLIGRPGQPLMRLLDKHNCETEIGHLLA